MSVASGKDYLTIKADEDNSGKNSNPLVARREGQAAGGKASSKGSKSSSSINESFTLKKAAFSGEGSGASGVDKKTSQPTPRDSLH